MSIIGIVLGVIAIGLIFWFKKEQQTSIDFLEGEAGAIEHGFTALMKDFTNYQVETNRKIAELEKTLEIKSKNVDRQIDKIEKDLPSIIKKIIGHIEFAKPMNR